MTRKTLKRTDVTAVIDTREQRPLDLSPLKVVRARLSVGNYSVLGLEDHVAIVRMELGDLIACIVGVDREPFERDIIERLLAYPVRHVVVEASWRELQDKVTPARADAVRGWFAQGVPFEFAGSHDEAGQTVATMLFIEARRAWRQLQAFQKGLGTAADG